ncbi:uncharacterized protein LOC135468417 [Liolophura sinensis]|uniref:uncharacterized protein LOC135468417 n=1 Tax=Liolophura sinensis TaxID=3198878 RepID=UPI0031590959
MSSYNPQTHSACCFFSHKIYRKPKRLKLLCCIIAYVILLSLRQVGGNYEREPRLRTTSSWKAILSWISAPVQYLPQDKPFFTVWNVPSFRCGHKYGLPMDLDKFGIVDNEFELFHGQTINLFYESRLGLYPRYLSNRRAKYGGIPQLGNLTAHLDWVKTDLDWYIPNVTYDGLAVIDWESWRPLFVRNWGEKSVYREASEKLVQKLHPTWTWKLVVQEAQRQFEKAARSFMVETLFLCRRLRPRAKWGFYLFPECYNHPPGRENCTRAARSRNDRLSWLYKSSSALYPSIYLHAAYKPQEQRQHVRGILQEAYRVRSKFTSRYLPVIPYSRYVYSQSNEFYNKVALENTVGQAAISGADGVVLWDSSSNIKNEKQCKRLHKYLNSMLGPYVKSVLDWTERCSRTRCSGHGRCVSLQYMENKSRKPGRVSIGRGPIITKVKISPHSHGHVFDMKNLSSKTTDLESSARNTVIDSLYSTRTTVANRLFSMEGVTERKVFTRKTVIDREPSTRKPVIERVTRFTTKERDMLPSAGTVTQRFTKKDFHVTSRKTTSRIIGTQHSRTRSNYTFSIDGSKLTSPTDLPHDNLSNKTPFNLYTLSSSAAGPTTTQAYGDISSTGSTQQVFTDKNHHHVNNDTKVSTPDFLNNDKTHSRSESTTQKGLGVTSDVHQTMSRYTRKQQTDTIVSTSEGRRGATRLTTSPITVTNPNQHSWTGRKSEHSNAKSTRWYTTTGIGSWESDIQTISSDFTAVTGLTIPEMTTMNTDSVMDVEHNTPIPTMNTKETSDSNSSFLNTITQIIIIIILNILRIFRHSPTHDEDHKLPMQYQSLYSELELQDHPRISLISGAEHSQRSDHVDGSSNKHYETMLSEEPPQVHQRYRRRVNNATPKRKWVMLSFLNSSSGLVTEDNTDLHKKVNDANKAQRATSLHYSGGQSLQTQISGSVIPSPESQIVISEGHISKPDHSHKDRDNRPPNRWMEQEFVDFVCACYAGWTGEFCSEKL